METSVSIPSKMGRIKELTNQLLREESMVATFFHICPDMLCIIDRRGKFVEVNDAWESTLHWSQEQLISEYVVAFVHINDARKTRDALHSLGEEVKVVRFCSRFKARSGDHKPLEWSAALGEDGNIYASARVVPQGCFECDRTKTKT